jgi:hypothetical protein
VSCISSAVSPAYEGKGHGTEGPLWAPAAELAKLQPANPTGPHRWKF